jgi:predicted kinase
MPTLFCLVGLPASGKSTWVKAIQADYPNARSICPDRIRANLYGDPTVQGDWATIESVVRSELTTAAQAIASNIVPFAIYDATNAVQQHRMEAIALARHCGFTTIIAVWFDCPIGLCLARNQMRSRQVPRSVLESMDVALRSHPPTLSDGFDQIFPITPATSWASQQQQVASSVASWV